MPAHSAATASIPVNITIHGLDTETGIAFRDFAAKTKASLNSAAKELFRRALGLPTAEEAKRIAEWNRVCGSLSDGAAKDLHASLVAQRSIDEELWK